MADECEIEWIVLEIGARGPTSVPVLHLYRCMQYAVFCIFMCVRVQAA